MRIALSALLVVHGLIHLMGFAKAWKLAELPDMTGQTLLQLPPSFDRTLGSLWLAACVGLVSAAGLLLFRNAQWRVVAGVAIVMSQLLVTNAWPDAKWGTLPNVLIALAVLGVWSEKAP